MTVRSAETASNGRDAEGAKRGSSIQRVLEVLEQVGCSESPLTASDLSHTLGIPKASAHRLCAQLQEAGFVQAVPGGTAMEPGARLREIARRVLVGGHRHAERQAVLARLAARVGETCNLAVPDGVRMLYLDRVEADWPIRVQFSIGSSVPLHCTASGKMYLSSLPELQRARLLRQLTFDRHGPNTLTSMADLEGALKLSAARGYATDNEEFIAAMVAMAVPVLDRDNRALATLSIQALKQRSPLDELRDRLEELQIAARELAIILSNDSE